LILDSTQHTKGTIFDYRHHPSETRVKSGETFLRQRLFWTAVSYTLNLLTVPNEERLVRSSTFPIMLFACLAAFSIPATHAQTYPAKPLRLILPFAPGGGTDVVARLVGQHITEHLGQPVIIDHRPGAGGIVGTHLAVQAEADGYTLLMGLPANITVSPAMYKKLPYDPLKDLTPVGLAGTSAYVLSVHPSLPAKTVAELIRLARARPGEIQYAAGPPGAGNHLAAELFKSMTRTKMLHVPYKGGGPALVGIMTGEAQVIFGSMLTTVPHIRAGRLRPLGVTSARRASALPELPTIAEAGVPGYEVDVWFGIFVPRGTPGAVISTLNEQLVRAMKDSGVKATMANQGMEPRSSTPEGLAELVKSEVSKWARVVRESGATVN
jgi:tripartite-type tricarboxylate transporter receptor subunit TctC